MKTTKKVYGSYKEGGLITTRKLPRMSYTLRQTIYIDRLNRAETPNS